GTQKEHTYWPLPASLLLVIRHSGSPVYTPLRLLRGGPHCTTFTCAFTQPRLGCDLQGIPGTPEWWCVAEVKVIELVDSDASVQSCRDHIDALGDRAADRAEHLRAQHSSRLPIGRQTDDHLLRARVIHFVVPRCRFDRQRRIASGERLTLKESSARDDRLE